MNAPGIGSHWLIFLAPTGALEAAIYDFLVQSALLIKLILHSIFMSINGLYTYKEH